MSSGPVVSPTITGVSAPASGPAREPADASLGAIGGPETLVVTSPQIGAPVLPRASAQTAIQAANVLETATDRAGFTLAATFHPDHGGPSAATDTFVRAAELQSLKRTLGLPDDAVIISGDYVTSAVDGATSLPLMYRSGSSLTCLIIDSRPDEPVVRTERPFDEMPALSRVIAALSLLRLSGSPAEYEYVAQNDPGRGGHRTEVFTTGDPRQSLGAFTVGRRGVFVVETPELGIGDPVDLPGLSMIGSLNERESRVITNAHDEGYSVRLVSNGRGLLVSPAGTPIGDFAITNADLNVPDGMRRLAEGVALLRVREITDARRTELLASDDSMTGTLRDALARALGVEATPGNGTTLDVRFEMTPGIGLVTLIAANDRPIVQVRRIGATEEISLVFPEGR